MPYSYNIDVETGCVFVKFRGKISKKELNDYINQTYSDPALPEPVKKLVDARDVTDVDIHYDDAVISHDILSQYNEKLENCIIAIAAPSDATYGISRMLEAINHDIMNIHVFRDINEAMEFLNISRPDYSGNTFTFPSYCVAA